MKKFLSKASIISALVFALAMPVSALHAQVDTSPFFGGDESTFVEDTGLGQADLQTSIGQLINIALGFLGIVAVVVILFGGFKWMTAGGNDERVGEAKKLIIAGVIGLAIILSAVAISRFVIASLLKATT